MREEGSDHLLGLIRRMPEWVRTDLSSKDAALRERAEDTLAAMLRPAGEKADASV
jgi:hypothetical protein